MQETWSERFDRLRRERSLELILDHNGIRTIEHLMSIVKHCGWLYRLSVESNPICNDVTSMTQLYECCEQYEVLLQPHIRLVKARMDCPRKIGYHEPKDPVGM